MNRGTGHEEECSVVAFEALEREYHRFIAEIEADPALEHVHLAHEKLFSALSKCQLNEKRLIRKNKALNHELVNGAAQIQKAVQMAKENEVTVTSLQHDLQKAWNMAEESHQKEAKLLEKTLEYQQQISSLTTTVQEGTKETNNQTKQMKDLLQERDKLQASQNAHGANLLALERQVNEGRTALRRMEAAKSEIQLILDTSNKELATAQQNATKEAQGRANAENELKTLQNELSQNTDLRRKAMQEVQVLKEEQLSLRNDLEAMTNELNQSNAKIESLKVQLERTTTQLDKERSNSASLGNDLKQIETSVGLLTAEQTRLVSEKKILEIKFNEKKQALLKSKSLVDESKASLTSARDEIKTLTKEIERAKQIEDKAQQEVKALQREKNLFMDQIQTSKDKVKEAGGEIQEREQIAMSLEKEIIQLKLELRTLESSMRQLERDVKTRDIQITTLRLDYDVALKQLETKDVQIGDLKKVIEDYEQKIKRQQDQYDAKTRDLNNSSAQLHDKDAYVRELKEEIDTLKRQRKRLEEELNKKDFIMVSQERDHQQSFALSEKNEHQAKRLQGALKESNYSLQQKQMEVEKLEASLQKLEENLQNQTIKFAKTTQERDVLGTQLLRRNDELALLGEKIRLQRLALKTGEEQYGERLEEIRILKLKIKDLQQELIVAKTGSVSHTKIAHQLIQKHQELLCEQIKVRALSDELENPMNLHRWRKLEGSDPAMYEMIQKVQRLQRRLIRKNEQVRSLWGKRQ